MLFVECFPGVAGGLLRKDRGTGAKCLEEVVLG